MARRFLTNINLEKNELQNARIQNLATAPSSPVSGQIYFATDLDALRFWDGTAWVDVISTAGNVTSVSGTAPIQTSGTTSVTVSIDAASGLTAGSMSSAHYTKLEGIESGATANSSDTFLLDRTNHTGTQAISTVSGLQTALDGKVDENVAITGATHPKITYDSKGLVTSGEALVAADIPNLATSKITSGSFSVARGGTGLSSVTLGNFLTGNGTGALLQRTPAQVLSDIGAAPVSHTHAISDVTNLQTSLDAKADDSDLTAHTTNTLNPHSVTKSQVGLGSVDNVSAADLRDRSTHTGTQAISTVSGLQGALDAKIDDTEKGAANGVATLDSGSKIPTNQLPALAITETYVVADITARDALSVQTGDIAVVLDRGDGEPETYIWDGTAWQQLLSPTKGVTEVAGGVGITSTGGDTPEISITAGGVGTTQLADEGVTEAKLSSAVQTKLNSPDSLKHAATIGDGIATEFVITHNFGTRDVQVTVYEAGSPYAQVETTVEHTAINSVTVKFASAPSSNEFRVVILG